MNKKSWIVFGLAVVGIIAWMAISSKSNQISLETVNKDAIIGANDQNGSIGDHVIGDMKAKVVIVEYGDYQCSACAAENPQIEKIVKSYESGVALVYRHYPLPGHSNAKAAAGAAEAANQQGKFWEMHNRLFATYQNWQNTINGRDAVFEGFAKELGLDLEKYRQDIKGAEISQKIAFDTALGRAHDLRETPTIIVNGNKIAGEVWSDDVKFRKLIDTELSK